MQLPPNFGPPGDVQAIEKAMAALAAGNQRGDARNFANLVTDQFVALTSTGIANKQDRIAAISQSKPATPTEQKIEQRSTRVYGDIAVTNRVYPTATGRTVQTIVHVRDTGNWLRAAIAFTPIAGATR